MNFLFLTCQNTSVLLEEFLIAVPSISPRLAKTVNVNLATDTKEILNEVREKVALIANENEGHLIVINLLPGIARKDKSDIEYLIQSETETVVFCLEVLKMLSKMNKQNITFGVVIAKSLMWENDKSIQNPNFPVAATIFGLARTVMLEQSSMHVLCADINPQLTYAECCKVLQFFCKNNRENEMLVRPNGCLLPRLERLEYFEDIGNEEDSQISPTSVRPFNSQSKYLSCSPVKRRFSVKVDPVLLPPSSNELEMKVSYISSFSSDISPLLENVKIKNASSLLKFTIGNVLRAGGTVNERFTPGRKVMACFKSTTVSTSIRLKADQCFILPDAMAAHHIAALLPPMVNSYSILMENGSRLIHSQSILVVFGNKGQGLSLSMVLLATALSLDITCVGNFPTKIIKTLNVKTLSYHEITQYIHYPKPVFDFIFCPTAIVDVMLLAVAKMMKPMGCFVLLDCSNGSDIISAPIPKTCLCVHLNAIEAPYLQLDNIHATWRECVKLLEASGLLSTVLELPQHVIMLSDVVCGSEYYTIGLQTLELTSIDDDVIQGKIMVERPALDIFGMKKNLSYLVVGGHRGFGLETLKWLIRRGAAFVVACGRSTLTALTQEVCFTLNHIPSL